MSRNYSQHSTNFKTINGLSNLTSLQSLPLSLVPSGDMQYTVGTPSLRWKSGNFGTVLANEGQSSFTSLQVVDPDQLPVAKSVQINQGNVSVENNVTVSGAVFTNNLRSNPTGGGGTITCHDNLNVLGTLSYAVPPAATGVFGDLSDTLMGDLVTDPLDYAGGVADSNLQPPGERVLSAPTINATQWISTPFLTLMGLAKTDKLRVTSTKVPTSKTDYTDCALVNDGGTILRGKTYVDADLQPNTLSVGTASDGANYSSFNGTSNCIRSIVDPTSTNHAGTLALVDTTTTVGSNGGKGGSLVFGGPYKDFGADYVGASARLHAPTLEGAYGGKLRVQTATTAGAMTDAMMIDHLQQVGVGTATPSSRFQVANGTSKMEYVQTSDDIKIQKPSGIARLTVQSDNNLALIDFSSNATLRNQLYSWNGVDKFSLYSVTSNTNPLTVDNATGNIGVHQTSPSEKLDVNGNTKINGTLTVAGCQLTGNNILEFGQGVAGKETNAGKCGYGLFGESQKLAIVGAGTTTTNRVVKMYDNVEVPETVSSKYVVASRLTGAMIDFSSNATLRNQLYSWNNVDKFSLYSVTSNTNPLTVDNTNGNIGVHQTSPSEKLDVNGNTKINGDFSVEGNVKMTGGVDNYIELGSGLVKEGNAGKVGYELFTSGSVDIVGAGTENGNRKVKVFDRLDTRMLGFDYGVPMRGNGVTYDQSTGVNYTASDCRPQTIIQRKGYTGSSVNDYLPTATAIINEFDPLILSTWSIYISFSNTSGVAGINLNGNTNLFLRPAASPLISGIRAVQIIFRRANSTDIEAYVVGGG